MLGAGLWLSRHRAHSGPAGAGFSDPVQPDSAEQVKPGPTEPYWETLRVGPDEERFERLVFLTRAVGYAASRHAVYKTENGGKDWKRVRNLKGGRVHFLYFPDAQTGWLGTDQLLYTDDGGQTWSQIALPHEEKLLAVNNLSVGPNGWALAGGTTAAGELALFCKRDAAAKWQSFKLVTENDAGGTDEPYRTWSLGGAAILGPREAVLVLFRGDPEEGVVLRTADGFETWTVSFRAEMDLYRVRFAGARRGWLSGSHGALWSTEDGGITWQPQPDREEGTLGCLAFDPEGKLGVAPLHQGKVLMTTDGRTWHVAEVPLGYSMPGAAVVDPGCVYVLGGDGRLARYVDPRVKPAE
jgi:photosystem II stability/assembly factor-like uncharacterized protein